jgi:hypothetical protein
VDDSRESEQETMARSETVLKMIAGSPSVRSVATCVPTGTDTAFCCAADNQKVTSVRAATGGNRRTPISSRNFT